MRQDRYKAMHHPDPMDYCEQQIAAYARQNFEWANIWKLDVEDRPAYRVVEEHMGRFRKGAIGMDAHLAWLHRFGEIPFPIQARLFAPELAGTTKLLLSFEEARLKDILLAMFLGALIGCDSSAPAPHPSDTSAASGLAPEVKGSASISPPASTAPPSNSVHQPNPLFRHIPCDQHIFPRSRGILRENAAESFEEKGWGDLLTRTIGVRGGTRMLPVGLHGSLRRRSSPRDDFPGSPRQKEAPCLVTSTCRAAPCSPFSLPP